MYEESGKIQEVGAGKSDTQKIKPDVEFNVRLEGIYIFLGENHRWF
jgi:hypothetical protein